MYPILRSTAVLTALIGAGLFAVATRPAAACGGLFCSRANPVEQAAERILFVDHGDGSMSALIEIQYEGPSERFAWVLPMPGTPEIRVGSNVIFDRMQGLTDPSYRLSSEVKGACADFDFGDGDAVIWSGALDAGAAAPGIIIQASGETGPYTYTVLSVEAGAADPAQVAVDWLTDNDYDVSGVGTDLIRPYLADGLNLVAVKLTKGNDAGAIRPLWLKYESDTPTIPIRPTAVAARPDMGILLWLISDHRGVPINYLDLHLNEARINWFNWRSTYDEVVTAAADEAGGQGFVTEFAGSTKRFENLLREQAQWEAVKARANGDAVDFVFDAVRALSGFNGLQEVVERWVTGVDGFDVQEFFNCPTCFDGDDPRIAIDVPNLLMELDESVAKPAFDAAQLATAGPYVTRLYTTMSADEMTHDPIFKFNPDLPDVSNLHEAKRVIECQDDVDINDAPWQVTLPSGAVLWGAGGWPVFSDADMPANAMIQQQGTSGEGQVMVDNTEKILRFLSERAPTGQGDGDGDDVMGPSGPGGPDSPRPGAPSAGGKGPSGGGSGAEDAGMTSVDPGAMANAEGGDKASLGCDCSTASGAGLSGLAPWLIAMVLLRRRRRPLVG